MLESFETFKKETKLISAFPACGKSYLFDNQEDMGLKVLDSDSSTFDKSEFPDNYIAHIKENIGKADIIMISSHKEVRDALVKNELNFTVVFPLLSLKDEYMKRYKDRGNEEKFISLLDSKWNEWITELNEQTNCLKCTLDENQYLSDVLNIIL